MKLLILSIFVFVCGISSAQLPQSWVGHYRGELHAISFKNDSINYHMELIIKNQSDSTYDFTIIYGEDSSRQIRPYTLISTAPNQFLLDENNSIVLNVSMINNTLYSVFEVQENLLHIAYKLNTEGIVFELSSSVKGELSGGSSQDSEEEIPFIQSYVTGTYQIAHLKRVP